MEKEISVGYVQGYNDASKTMHHMINDAIKRNGNNLVGITNEIIGGMYKQKEEVKELVDYLEFQLDSSPDVFDDYEECCQKEVFPLEDILAQMFGTQPNFIIIKGGRQ